MIEINLLPDDVKEARKSVAETMDVPILPIAGGVVGIVLAIQLIVIFMATGSSMTLGKLKKEMESIGPKKKEILELNSKLNELKNKVQAIDELTGDRLLWAEIMNTLSDSMTQSVWLTTFNYEKRDTQQVLAIEGYSTEASESGTAIIAKLINELKNNPEFFKYFQEIELDSLRSSMYENKEIMRFRLLCTFKNRGEI